GLRVATRVQRFVVIFFRCCSRQFSFSTSAGHHCQPSLGGTLQSSLARVNDGFSPLPAVDSSRGKITMTRSFAACGHGAIERLHGAASVNEKENLMATNNSKKTQST